MKKSIGIFLILNLSFALAQSISGTVTDENCKYLGNQIF